MPVNLLTAPPTHVASQNAVSPAQEGATVDPITDQASAFSALAKEQATRLGTTEPTPLLVTSPHQSSAGSLGALTQSSIDAGPDIPLTNPTEPLQPLAGMLAEPKATDPSKPVLAAAPAQPNITDKAQTAAQPALPPMVDADQSTAPPTDQNQTGKTVRQASPSLQAVATEASPEATPEGLKPSPPTSLNKASASAAPTIPLPHAPASPSASIGPIQTEISSPPSELIPQTLTADSTTMSPATPRPGATPPPAQPHISAPDASEQVRAAIQTRGSQTKIEVQLDPPELGRVVIELEMTAKGSVRAIVSAVEVESLDLLRRHASEFADDLRDQGFDDIDLAFGGEASADQGDREALASAEPSELSTHQQTPQITTLSLGSTLNLSL